MLTSARCCITIAIFSTLSLYGAGSVAFAQSVQSGTKNQDANGVLLANGKVHPLTYFLHDFTSRQSEILCFGCARSDGRRIALADFNVVTEKRAIDATPGHVVQEVHTKFFDKPDGAAGNPATEGSGIPVAIWKSIFVEVTPGMYREIYFFETEPGVYVEPLSWATTLELDHQRILTTNDRIDGNGAMCTDGYWSLEGAGAAIVDFSQVDKALASHTPKGSLIGETRCWALDMATQTIHAHAQKPPLCKACSDTASITVHFHLQGPAAVPDHVETQLPDDDN